MQVVDFLGGRGGGRDQPRGLQPPQGARGREDAGGSNGDRMEEAVERRRKLRSGGGEKGGGEAAGG